MKPAREAELLAAASDLVARRGYDAVAVTELTARCGVGKATLYRRWRSKAQLMGAVATRLRDELTAIARSQHGSLEEDLCHLLCRNRATVAQALRVSQALATARASHPELALVVAEDEPTQLMTSVLTPLLRRSESAKELSAPLTSRDLAVAVAAPFLVDPASADGERVENYLHGFLVPLLMRRGAVGDG